MALDAGALRQLVLETNQAVHGVDAVVELPDGRMIETEALWLTTVPQDAPAGLDLHRADPLRIVAIARVDVPSLPRHAVIVAPERPGGPTRRWLVDGHDRLESDQHRVIVVRDPAEAASADDDHG